MKKSLEYFELLKSIDLFSLLDDIDLKALAEAAQEVEISAGHLLFEHHSTENSIFLILSGEICIFRNSKIISCLGEGEYFGELALLEDAVRSAAARANCNSILLELPTNLCRDLFLANPRMYASVTKTLGERLRSTNDQVVSQYERVNILIHDMRNLMCMLEYAQVVARELPVESEHREFLGFVRDGADRIEAMMNEALNIAKGERIDVTMASVDLGELARTCVEHDLAHHPDVERTRVALQLPEGLQPIVCSAVGLKRVLANLLINAAQASDPGAQIVVEVRQEATRTQILVTDWGSGIPEERQGRVFEPHFTSKEGGHGLGLAACKEIVEVEHQGALTFTTEVGVGTTFCCELMTNPHDGR